MAHRWTRPLPLHRTVPTSAVVSSLPKSTAAALPQVTPAGPDDAAFASSRCELKRGSSAPPRHLRTRLHPRRIIAQLSALLRDQARPEETLPGARMHQPAWAYAQVADGASAWIINQRSVILELSDCASSPDLRPHRDYAPAMLEIKPGAQPRYGRRRWRLDQDQGAVDRSPPRSRLLLTPNMRNSGAP